MSELPFSTPSSQPDGFPKKNALGSPAAGSLDERQAAHLSAKRERRRDAETRSSQEESAIIKTLESAITQPAASDRPLPPHLLEDLNNESRSLADRIDRIFTDSAGLRPAERRTFQVKIRTDMLASLENQLQTILSMEPRSQILAVGGPIENVLTQMTTIRIRFGNRLGEFQSEDDSHQIQATIKSQRAFFRESIAPLQALLQELMDHPDAANFEERAEHLRKETIDLQDLILGRFDGSNYNGNMYILESIRAHALVEVRTLQDVIDTANLLAARRADRL